MRMRSICVEVTRWPVENPTHFIARAFQFVGKSGKQYGDIIASTVSENDLRIAIRKKYHDKVRCVQVLWPSEMNRGIEEINLHG